MSSPQGVEVRRSRSRKRTVSAYRAENGTIVVLLPARMTRAEEREWVATMVTRVERSEARRQPSDDALAKRATQLSDRYLDGRARPATVRWVTNQDRRWGSCTPADRAIRLSTRLQGMPSWVVDYVLLHELAHLLEVGHTQAFWKLVDQLPRAERAKGFLEGASTAAGWQVTDAEPSDGGEPADDVGSAAGEPVARVCDELVE